MKKLLLNILTILLVTSKPPLCAQVNMENDPNSSEIPLYEESKEKESKESLDQYNAPEKPEIKKQSRFKKFVQKIFPKKIDKYDIKGSNYSDPESPLYNTLQEKETVLKQVIKEAQNAINDAYEYLQSGNIKNAEDILSDIESNLPNTVMTEDIFSQIQVLRAEIFLKQAEDSYKDGRIKETREFLKKYNALKKPDIKKQDRFGKIVQRILPKKIDKPDVKEQSQFANDLSKDLNDPHKQNLAEINPSYIEKMRKGEQLVLKGKAQYINGDYLGAYNTFKTALLYNSLNNTAKAYLTIIDEELTLAGRGDYENTRSQLVRNVSESWQLARIFDRKTTEDNTTVAQNPIEKKLNLIYIEQIRYSSRELLGVVEDLSLLSVEEDKTGLGRTEGINIVLMDPDHNPRITATFRNVPLRTILETVTAQANCEFDIDGEIIKIYKKGSTSANTSSNLKQQMFPITRAAILDMTGGVNAMEGNTSSVQDDIFAAEPVSAVAENPTSNEGDSIKAFFERAGVSFSNNGASLVLASGGTKLYVYQTTRNLEKIQRILRDFDDTKQVRINSRFLEVRDGDLNEFGIRWYANSGENNFAGTTDEEGGLGTLRRLDNMSSTGTSNTGTVLRAESLESQTQRVVNGITLTDTLTTNTSLDPIEIKNEFPSLYDAINRGSDATPVLGLLRQMGDWDLNVKLRALEQKTDSDIMSSPSVTVLSGKTAEIMVGQEFRYPTSYSDAQATVNSGTSSGSSIAIVPGTPQDFEMRTIGVEMSVTPTVEADNKINLVISPRVTEFEGFVEHGGQIVGVGTTAQMIIPSSFLQPIFSTRRVDTEVTIFDGAVVVMGGLVRNEIKRVVDKVPFFGNLPIIGKAFQSKAETNQKRNLLIFVGANLVSPGGSTSKERFDTVEPNSLYQNPMIMTPGGSVPRSPK